MADAAIQFKSEAFHGEEITGNLFFEISSSFGANLLYQFLRNSGQEIARAKTGMVFFDYQKRALDRPPEGLSEFIENLW